MNNCHCDNLCKSTDSGVFHKVQELYPEGVDIYQYFKCLDNQDEPRGSEVNKHYKRVLVLQNKSNCDVSTNSIIDAIEYKNIKCQNCYEMLCQTARLLKALNILKRHEVIGICEHCKKIIKNDSCKCKHSIEAMRSFLNCRLREWFQKTCNLPCATRRERFRYDKAKRRASSKSEKALKIDELFPDYSNLYQRSKSAELESSKDYPYDAFNYEHTRNLSKQIIGGKPKELSKERVNTLDTEHIKSYTVDSKNNVLDSQKQKQIKKQTDIKDEEGKVSNKKLSDGGTKEIKRQTKDSTTKEKNEKDSKMAKPSQGDANNNILKKSKTNKGGKDFSKPEEQSDKNITSKILKSDKGGMKTSNKNDDAKSEDVLKMSKPEKGTTKDLKQKDKMDNNYDSKSPKMENGITKGSKQKDKTDNNHNVKLPKIENGTIKDSKQKDNMGTDDISKSTKTEKGGANDIKQKDKIGNDSILILSKTEKGTTKDLKQYDKINDPTSKLLKTEKVSSKPSKQNEEISKKHNLDINQKPDPADEIVLKQMKEAKEMKEKALEAKEREKALEAKAKEMKAQEKMFKQEEARKQKTDIEPGKQTLTATVSQMLRFQEKAKEQRNNIGEFNHKAKSMMSSVNEEIIKRLGLDTLPKTGKINIDKDGDISLLEFMKPTKKIQIQRFRSAHSVACALLDKTTFPVKKRINKKIYHLDRTVVKDENVLAENLEIFGTGDGKGQGANKALEDIESNNIIVGAEICKFNMNLLPKSQKETKPLLFKALERQQSRYEVKEVGSVVIEHDNKNKNQIRAFNKKPDYTHSKAPATLQKGVIRYTLSDRQFIESGWTMLPTQKVVRKMNMYRMSPARPEYDWFTRNKKRCPMAYDTGEKLAEMDDSGDGRWFYRNGLVSLDYYSAEEMNAQRRIVVYSSRLYENSTPQKQPRPTVLACFDWLGNGVVYDGSGNIRLKYNQTEGVLMDKSLGSTTYWKWHALNDPPVLQQVMIDTQLPHKDPEILKYGNGKSNKPIEIDDEEMLAIEHENFLKEKKKKLSQQFKPYQIKSKALKINDHFSLRVLDQATVYLLFRDGKNSLKLNLGMSLDPREIVDTETTDVGEVTSSYDKLPARTESLANIQKIVDNAKKREKYRTDRQQRIRRPERQLTVDRIKDVVYKPALLNNTPYTIL